MDKLWYLSRISIFDSLSPEDFKEIDMMAPMTHFNAVPKSTVIQTPEHHRDGLFFVKTGKLRMYKVNAEGKQFGSWGAVICSAKSTPYRLERTTCTSKRSKAVSEGFKQSAEGER